MCGLITIHADVTDLCARNECGQAGYHAEAGTKDRHDSELTARQHLDVCGLDWRFKLDGLRRKVRQGLEAHQHRDLLNELTELVGSGVLITQKGDLVRKQRVVHDVYICSKIMFHSKLL